MPTTAKPAKLKAKKKATPKAPADAKSAAKLEARMLAVRVSFTWMGTKRSLTNAQQDDAAKVFAADRDYLSASKKIIDTKHPAYRDLNGLRVAIRETWHGMTLPFTEPGVRLIRKDQITEFEAKLADYSKQFAQKAAALATVYDEIKEQAKVKLGDLFNPDDYPSSIEDLFGFTWDYPNVEPPKFLMEADPALYARERDRVRQQFEDAVRLAEAAFIDEFAKLVSHMCERLQPGEDGNPKKFQDTSVTNLLEFFEKFKNLNINSNTQLDEMVEKAKSAVVGVNISGLRNSDHIRKRTATALNSVKTVIDKMVTERPRRSFMRDFQD